MTFERNEPRATRPRSAGLTETFEVTPALTFAAYRNVCIAVWRETPNVRTMESIDRHLAVLTPRFPMLASVIVIEPTNFHPPDHAAREAHARLTKKYDAQTYGVAVIIDGTAVKHSVYRFVLTTVQLISSPRIPQQTFPSVRSAANWVTEFDRTIDADELAAAIKEVRELQPSRANSR